MMIHPHVTDNYNEFLVVLSFIIALLASYTALNLAKKVTSTKGWNQKIWLVNSAIVMGLGIWSMHFIAMLAYHLPEGVTYRFSIVIISIVVAVIGALVGLFVTFQSNLKLVRLINGGIIMGLAISGMHYIGMAALQGVEIRYQPFLFALSIIIAILASMIALYLSFTKSQRFLISGLIMGAAITGMHYTGMSAAVMTYHTSTPQMSDAHNLDYAVLAIYVAFGTIVIFAIGMISSLSVDRRLAEQMALKGSILESAIDCIMMFDHRGTIIEFNPAAEETFKYSREDAIGRRLTELFFSADQSNEGEHWMERLLLTGDRSMLGTRIETNAFRCDRSEFPVEIAITCIKNEGTPIYTAYLSDLTEKKRSEEMIQHLAYYDMLTGLPNRNLFNKLFLETMEHARKHCENMAVLFLDLDRFKFINDTLGHSVGDQLLQKFSTLLSGCMNNNSIVSRLSGDEFVILFPQGDREQAATLAENIIRALIEPFDINGQHVFITTSIGIALYPSDGELAEILLKNADSAMYSAKERGTNNYQFFERQMNLVSSRRMAIEQSLRSTFENYEFTLSYQPKFNFRTGKMIGVEALIRWESPRLGTVTPSEFIPVAEETGQIIVIGEWVLRTACEQMKRWHGLGLDAIPVAVNLSVLQFHHDPLIETISGILRQTGLDAKYLELEITESIALNKDSKIIEKLHALKEVGVSISFDDFGTGYCSLSYLRKFPIDTLKIDKSFVQDISGSSQDTAIVEAIIAMARSLKLDVLAEGVETEEQLAFLELQGCHNVQGYLFCKPLSAEQFLMKYVSETNGQPEAYITI